MIKTLPFNPNRLRAAGTGLMTLAMLPAVVSGADSSQESRAEYALELGAHAEYIENPRRQPDNDEEEFMAQARVRGMLRREVEHFNINIDYQGRKMDYKNDLLRDREVVTGNASVVWIAQPDFFSWQVSNSRTFQQVDSSLPDTTDNRQIVNVSSTGPELILQLGGADRITTRLDYSEADYSFNNYPEQKRYAGDVNYSHAFSPRLNVGLRANYLKSEFSDDELMQPPGFEVETYTIPLHFATESMVIDLEGGETRSKRDVVGENTNPFVRANFTYNLNARSAVTLYYSDQFSDLLSNINSRPDPIQDVLDDRFGNSNLFQIYQQVRYGAGYTYRTPDGVTLDLNYDNIERDFQEVLVGQEDERYSVGVTVPVGESLSFTLYGRHSDQEFLAQMRDQRRKEVALRGTWRAGRNLSFQLSVLHTDQESETFYEDNYDGLNAFLSINFRFGS